MINTESCIQQYGRETGALISKRRAVSSEFDILLMQDNLRSDAVHKQSSHCPSMSGSCLFPNPRGIYTVAHYSD